MNWDVIARDNDGFTAISVDSEVEAGIERMLNRLKCIELDWRLAELEDTPSWGMYWLIASARHELKEGNFSECLSWLHQAKQLAWYKLETWSKVEKCIELVYKIDQNVSSHYWWECLPVVEEKQRILTSVLPLIRPWVELARKRTRHSSLRFFLGDYFYRSSPVARLDYLLKAEFVASYFSTRQVRTLVQSALLEVIGGLYEYGK